MERNYPIIWFQTIDSTNSEARRRMAELDNLSVLAARCQTAGRGQRGNTWSASPGENLTFSIVLKFGEQAVPSLAAKDQHRLSVVLTVALAQYLQDRGIRASVKWPNDIYCADRKICGILVENTLVADHMSTAILGIGLNVNQTEFPPELPNPTSMALETGRKFDVEGELEHFLKYFDRCLTDSFTPEGMNALREEYLTRLYLKDQCREYIRAATQERFRGTIVGITDDFLLIINNSRTGRSETFTFKEIQYLIDGRAQV